MRAYYGAYGWDADDAPARLLRIAVEVAITHERGPRRGRGLARWMPAEVVGAGVPERRDQHPDLVAWLMRPLTPEQRALVILSSYRRMPAPEIARLFGIPVDSVAARLNRAMHVLRRRAQTAGALQDREHAAR